MPNIKTASDLKAYVQSEENHFFDRKTMRFFGDTMRNFGVRRASIVSEFDREGNYSATGYPREAYELYRRRPVKYGLKSSYYFDAETFARIHCVK